MSLVSTLYRNVFRRTSTMAVVVLGVAFAYERGAEVVSDYVWDKRNQGVSLI